VTDDPADTPLGNCLGGNCFEQVLMASWTSTVALDNVSIFAEVGADDSTATLFAYLMTQVGPGTTAANQLAAVTLTPPAFDVPGVQIFSGLHLDAGTYYLVMSGLPSEISFAYWYSYSLPITTSAPGITPGGFGFANCCSDPFSTPDTNYSPASIFDTVEGPTLSIQVTTAAAIAPEPGTVVELAAGFLLLVSWLRRNRITSRVTPLSR
jgi:hypothetical protein